MKRYILTGAPGAGKTALLRRLERAGFAVVEEAATDVIALAGARGVDRHWEEPTFIDDILALQLARQARADRAGEAVTVFDRSPVCTLALAEFLGHPRPAALEAVLDRIAREGVYERRVLFVENLDRIEHTAARRISLADALRFGALHARVYERLGFDLVRLPPADIEARFEMARAILV
ncbi:MAG TPA: AAA family ATPase [Caulobacteraceae bacterium]|nr:AAA family ATPase [Caulobacteraceae bacterium]